MALPARQGVCSWGIAQLPGGVELRASFQANSSTLKVVQPFPIAVDGILERVEVIGWSPTSTSFDFKLLDPYGADWMYNTVNGGGLFSPIGDHAVFGSSYALALNAVPIRIGGRPVLYFLGEAVNDYGTARIFVRNIK